MVEQATETENMFRPGLGAVGRILSRSHAAAAWLLSRPAGASKLRHLHSRSNGAAASSRHCFGFLRRYLKPHAVAIAGWSTAGVGLWYYMNLPPSEVDWVEAGVVSPVVRNQKLQKGCGSCWAMAAAASVEAVHYQNTLQSISLSVQELVDCDAQSNGCDGGSVSKAFTYIQANGLLSESSYPYKARRSKSGCTRNKIAATPATRISGFRLVDPTEDALEKAIAKQPVVVALESSDDFRKYKGGIIDYKAGETNRLHFVMIVGYGVDPDGVKYWRFKNSWGPRWGEGGFGRIRRYVDEERGVLGIFKWAGLYPVLED